MSDRDDEGVTATVDQSGSGSGRNGHGDEHEGRGGGTWLVGVLARALSTQVEQLAGTAPATPDGWWFAERPPPGTAGSPATGSAGETGDPQDRETAHDPEEQR